MSNLKITFEQPWFLLLLIPALALTIIPYFRLSKRYRRTRNRIISMVLHTIVMLLSITVLSGIAFAYEVPNPKNEIMLVVDYSHSNRASMQKKDNFIDEILSEPDFKEEVFHIGVVTFGRNQVYAAELSTNYDRVRTDYKLATRPDDSATNIEDALLFAASKFDNPESAKIVLLTDGLETDGNVIQNSTIVKLLKDGIRLDTVYFPDEYDAEVRVESIQKPENNIIVGETISIGVELESSFEGKATLRLFDFGEEQTSTEILLKKGRDVYYISHTFLLPGAHKLSVTVESEGDNLTQNNTFYSYFYIEVFDRILIVDGAEGESAILKDILGVQELGFKITVVNIANVPNTIEALREYDQIILVNVNRRDMPGPLSDKDPWRKQPSPGWENSSESFEDLLYKYVHDFGGGLFTVGGDKAFVRESMVNSTYQKLLPVEAVDYTPPLALVLIIDRSGSMSGGKLDSAKEGARACVDALSERDYVGLVTLESNYVVDISLTPVPQKQRVINAINNIPLGGGTVYSGAFDAAGRALLAVDVERRHILFVSDGGPASNDKEKYMESIQNLAKEDITISTVMVATDSSGQQVMKQIAEAANGIYYYSGADPSSISRYMRQDVRQERLTVYNPETFTPRITKIGGPVDGITQDDIPELDGFYGTKIKRPIDPELQDPDVYLVAKYVPIYAQWKYGKGKVGAFMCDLSGVWSERFVNDEYGQLFIKNTVKGLFPNENIRVQDIEMSFNTINYTTTLTVSSNFGVGESFEVQVVDPKNVTQTIRPDMTKADKTVQYSYNDPGFYEFTVIKKDAKGNEISRLTKTVAFSYSQEYNTFIKNPTAIRQNLENMAVLGKGVLIEDIVEENRLIPKNPGPIFEGFLTKLPRRKDPAMPFIITALILFLLDIAVRKFKFKWPWEIYRDSKAKKQLKKEPITI